MTEDLVSAVPPPLPPGVGEAAAPSKPKGKPYCGAPKPEHRQPPVIRTSPYSVTEGYRAIGRIVLPPTEKALLVALFVRVDAKTWRWPPRELSDRRGSSMVELAASIQRSVRHTRRLMRRLEGRGLVITTDRRPERNAYYIVPEALIAAGEAGQAEVRGVVRRDRQAREALQARADAELDGTAPEDEAPVEGPGEEATEESAEVVPVETLPGWATKKGAREGLPPAQVAGMVRAAWQAAGARGLWINEGREARSVVRVWRGLGEPSLAEWTALMDRLAAAVRGGRLNGRLSRGWVLTTRSLIKLAEDGVARDVAAEPPPAPPAPRAAAPESGAIVLPGPARAPDIGVDHWRTIGRPLLRERKGVLYDVWVKPLELVGLEDGELVLRAPNGVFATWIREEFAADMVEAAGGPVRIVWEA